MNQLSSFDISIKISHCNNKHFPIIFCGSERVCGSGHKTEELFSHPQFSSEIYVLDILTCKIILGSFHFVGGHHCRMGLREAVFRS